MVISGSSGSFIYFPYTSEHTFFRVKKSTLPSREELKESRCPYLDVEIAATRSTINRGLSRGYRLKTIWQTLWDSGDITGTYSGFRRAFWRSGPRRDYTDEIKVNEPRRDVRKTRSDRESEAALAEAKQALAAKAKRGEEK